MMLGPVLNLVNGPVVGEAIKDPNNRIAKILATEKNDAKVIEELYLAILCRPPTPRAKWSAGLAGPQGRRRRLRRTLAEDASKRGRP